MDDDDIDDENDEQARTKWRECEVDWAYRTRPTNWVEKWFQREADVYQNKRFHVLCQQNTPLVVDNAHRLSASERNGASETQLATRQLFTAR